MIINKCLVHSSEHSVMRLLKLVWNLWLMTSFCSNNYKICSTW